MPLHEPLWIIIRKPSRTFLVLPNQSLKWQIIPDGLDGLHQWRAEGNHAKATSSVIRRSFWALINDTLEALLIPVVFKIARARLAAIVALDDRDHLRAMRCATIASETATTLLRHLLLVERTNRSIRRRCSPPGRPKRLSLTLRSRPCARELRRRLGSGTPD